MGKYLDSLGLSHLIGLIKTALGLKQDTLVSGTNIKTINNESLLGSGNISVSGGGSLPSGGMQGAILAKASANDGDVTWAASVAPFKVYASSSNTVQAFCGFRELVAADIPSLTISKISNLQTTLDGKQDAGDYWEAVKDNAGYYGLQNPEGGTTGWVRTTANGLIPAVSGGSSSSLGTSTWPFNNLYAQNIYHNGTKLGTAATHNHGDYIASTDSRVNSITSTNQEVYVQSLNGLARLALTYNSTTGVHNLRVDTRASTSDAWASAYYPGIWPVNETTIANVVTQTSAQSSANPITAAKYYSVNGMAMLEISFKPAAARAAGTAFDLGTVVSGKRPHLFVSGGSQTNMARMTTAGAVQVVPRGALTAGTTYTIGFTYLT